MDRLLGYRPPVGPTHLEALFKRSLQLLKHPSLFFVVSDFILTESVLHSALLARIASVHDLVPVVIEDRLEEQLPSLGGYIRLRDSESAQTVRLTLSTRNCQVFSSHMKERQIALRRAFLRLGVVPILLNTGRSPLHPLMEFFLRRKRGR
jgi:hypothetical protein